MKVRREDFLNCLHAVSSGLASGKEIIEQSSSFVFRKGLVCTFNDELFCSIKSPLEIEGAVPATHLLTILQKLPDDEISVAVDGAELKLTGKGRRVSVAMEADIVLPVDSVEVPESWAAVSEELPACISSVCECASKDGSQFSLVCVHLGPDFVEACDNHQILRYTVATGLEEPVLVRASAMKAVGGIAIAEVAVTENFLHFRGVDGVSMSVRKYTEEYPDLSNLAQFEGGSLTIPGGLVQAADRASVFSDAGDKQVQVAVKGEKAKITGTSAYGTFEEIMKVKYSGEPVAFNIQPKLLASLVDRGGRVIVGDGRIRIEEKTAAVPFVYITATFKA